MALETTIVPRAPYSLALSARLGSDTTRRFRDGVLDVAFAVERRPARARVRQRPDGSLAVAVESETPAEALDRLRFVLAADEDVASFHDRFADDRLVGRAVRSLRGLRPLRTATVTHALVKAVCGQLIQARAARQLEARLIRRLGTPFGDFFLPPTRETFGGLAPPGSRATGWSRGRRTRSSGSRGNGTSNGCGAWTPGRRRRASSASEAWGRGRPG